VSSAGDVDGDRIDDLIIGAIGASPNGNRAGASYVVFGTDQGFPATIDLATDADLVIQRAAAFDLSGWSVSDAGDINATASMISSSVLEMPPRTTVTTPAPAM
jgi:FG-GAP repeat